jgi:hypothetical protein
VEERDYRLIELFNSNHSDDVKTKLIEEYINSLDISVQLSIHSGLSKDEKGQLYRSIRYSSIDNNVKEHIFYSFYNSIEGSLSNPINEQIFEQLIYDYNETQFLGLLSALINWLKNDFINDVQVKKIGNMTMGREVSKQVLLYNARRKLCRNEVFNEQWISELLFYEAYDAIIEILNKKAINRQSLTLFHEPIENEKYKKKKSQIFNMVQDLLKMLK